MGRLLRSYTLVAVSYSLLIVGCASGGNTGQNTGPGTGPGGGNTGIGGGGGISPGTGIGFDGDGKNCGNGVQDINELCDDANVVANDGCSPLCQIEADYTCPAWGQPCTNTAVCGDGFLSSVEACDDSNTNPGDGCSADCKAVDPGWQCRVPGKACIPLCGDSVVTPPENCDDGNAVGGDGCSVTCLTEPGYSCTGTPSVCTAAECGNGVVETGESCDKGKENGLFHGDGTGCSRTCTIEPVCRNESGVTTACVTRCGDGNIDTAQGEECDDANGVAGDGCSADCKKEGGFTCVDKEKKDAQPCASGTGDCLQLPITYRDFDGANQATGHPDFLYYGATPVGGKKIYCVPNASGRTQGLSGSCPGNDSTALCLGLAQKTLDTDGKPAADATRSGGLTCACQFTDWDKTPISTEINALGAALPAGITTSKCSSGGSGEITVIKQTNAVVIQSPETFKQWYSDSTFSTKSVGVLELAAVAGAPNNYRFTASNGRTLYDDIHDIWLAKNNQAVPAGAATSLSSGFFPLEAATGTHAVKMCNLWPYWTAPATCVKDQWDVRGGTGSPPPGATAAAVTGMQRNFYFTTEARYLFRYAGGETLTFHGDDDVWVYVNGKLVLDMGAPHERLEGTVTLTATGANAVLRSQDVITQAFAQVGTPQTTTGLGLEVGRTYEIAIFHADHHPRDSNYQLTLTGFSRTYSECGPTCGDGVVTVGEECDLGAANQDGLYGGCTTKCIYGPFCGDGVKDAEEDCDLGRGNTGGYGTNGCTPGCKLAHFCGDGNLDSAFGEACDAGTSKSSACGSDCQIILQ